MKRYIHANASYAASNASNRTKAHRILRKYSGEQIAFVAKCDEDIKLQIAAQFEEDWDPEISALNIEAIKTDYMIEADEEGLLTHEQFEELLSAIDILDTESANAWA